MKNSIISMTRALHPIGLYSLNISDLVYKELQAYAVCFDEISEVIDEIMREIFIDTAQDIGITTYEELVGPRRTDHTLEERRDMIKALLAANENDFTTEGIMRFFESIGFECTIAERPEFFELDILPQGRLYSKAEQDLIIARANAFLPCHLNVVIEFRTTTWNAYDNMLKSFDEWDEMGLTWDRLDRYEGE